MNVLSHRFGSSARSTKSSAPAVQRSTAGSIELIAQETGASISSVRMFAEISSPSNAQLFTAEAASKAFAHLKQSR